MQHPFLAFGPHGADWLYILIIVLVLFGSTKLPQLARGLGKSLGEFKKAKEEFEKEVNAATTAPDVKPETDQNRIGGNLPAAVTPVPEKTATTSADGSTKTT